MIPALEELLESLAAHGTFLLLVLPLIGAVLVWASVPLGSEVVRRTALTNVVLSVLLSVWMLVQFQPPAASGRNRPRSFQFQMAGEADFEIGMNAAVARRTAHDAAQSTDRADIPSRAENASLLRIAVGTDGLNVWFPLLVALLMLALVCDAGRSPQPAGRLVLLLLWHSALVGVFAALDVLFFMFCLETSAVLFFLLTGRCSAPENRRESLPGAVGQLAGSLLVFLGLMLAAVAHQWLTAESSPRSRELNFSLVQLTSETGERMEEALDEVSPQRDYWSSLEPLIFITLTLGLAVKSAVFPFHGSVCSPRRTWPLCVALPACAVMPCVGVYAWLRLAATVCPQSAAHFGPALTWIMLLGAGYCALCAVVQRQLKDVLGYTSAAQMGMALAAAATLAPAGTTAAVLLLIGHAAGFGLLVLVVASVDVREKTPVDSGWAISGSRFSHRAFLFLLAVFSVAGLPGLCGFPPLWLLVQQFMQNDQLLNGLFAGGMTVAVLSVLPAWAFLRSGWQVVRENGCRSPATVKGQSGRNEVRGAQRESGTRRSIRGWNLNNLTLALPLGCVLLAVGLAPQFVVNRARYALQVIAPGQERERSPRRDGGPAQRPTPNSLRRRAGHGPPDGDSASRCTIASPIAAKQGGF